MCVFFAVDGIPLYSCSVHLLLDKEIHSLCMLYVYCSLLFHNCSRRVADPVLLLFRYDYYDVVYVAEDMSVH